jgi:ferredoxin-type protein NapG
MNEKPTAQPKTKQKPKRKTKKLREQGRREFLRSTALLVGMVGASLAGLIPLIGQANARLRPPGALKDRLDEHAFLSACIKCGQCVQVCPVEAIKLADLNDGVGVGVPHIEARDQACDFSCDGLQCVLACPTGALTHDIDYPAETRMGFARVARPGRCLAVRGQPFKGAARGPDHPALLRFESVDRWNPIPLTEHPFDLPLCDLCVRLCPIEIRIAQCEAGTPPSGDPNQCPPLHAIRMQPMPDGRTATPVVEDGCVGCGVCEMVCPAEPAAIVVDIHRSADFQ